MNILLIGLRGSGKSTIGRALAQAAGSDFIDLDDLTREMLGVATVGEAWRRFGERVFRDAEATSLSLAMVHQGAVIALGGGTPTAPGCAEMIERARAGRRARVVYLRLTPAELRGRLAADAGDERPSLTGASPLDEIEDVFRRRDALYAALADAVLEGERPVEAAVRELLPLTGR